MQEKSSTQKLAEAQEQIVSLRSAIRHNEQAIDEMRSMVSALESCLHPENRTNNTNIIQLDSSSEKKASESQSA